MRRWQRASWDWPVGLDERGVGRGDVVGILTYNCPEFLETVFAINYLGAIAMPINWRLAAPEVRYILEHSGARALVCDELLIDLANEATGGMDGALLRACVASTIPDGWTRLDDLEATSNRRPRAPVAPDDVHRLMYTSGTTGSSQGCHDLPCQPGVEELGAHHRVRLHELRPRAGLWAPVSRRRARPDDHLTHRGGCDHDHPSLVRGVRSRRRTRTIEGEHGVVGAGHGQRHHGGARRRGA